MAEKSTLIELVKSKCYAREVGERFVPNFRGLGEAQSRLTTEYVKNPHFHG
jgi:hypothetical protein